MKGGVKVKQLDRSVSVGQGLKRTPPFWKRRTYFGRYKVQQFDCICVLLADCYEK